MARLEIRVTGFGGQGIVLLAHILGRAVAVNAGKHATMLQSFGPEARGSVCAATLAISESEVLYPYVHRPDILVAMSADGYTTHAASLADDGILVFDQDLVHPPAGGRHRAFGAPAARLAEGLGRTIVQNIVMLGFVTAVTGLTTRQQMREAVEACVPAGTEELNLRAFDTGYDFAAGVGAGATLEEARP